MNADNRNTYAAGLRSFNLRDTDGIMPCALWYPCATDAKIQRHGVYDFCVAKNATLAEGAFPVIVMSHGSGGTMYGHCKTAEFFAEQGYMVLAVQHPKNNFFDDTGRSRDVYESRSRHLKLALDHLLENEGFSAHIDPNKIAVFGFSLGGFTALTAIGALADRAGLRAHQAQNQEFDRTFCDYGVMVKDPVEADILHTTADNRYRAGILLAPVSGGLFHKDSLRDVKIPVQIFRAERDMVLRNPFHGEQIRDHLVQNPDYHVIEKAGHFSFLSPVAPDAREGLGEFANDMRGFNREKVHAQMHELMLEFLEKALS